MATIAEFTDTNITAESIAEHKEQNMFPVGETFEQKLEQFKQDMAKPVDAPEKIAEPAKAEPKTEAKPESKKPEFAITDETPDEDLDKHIAESVKGPTAKDAFKHKTYELREARRQAKNLAADKEEMTKQLEALKANSANGDAAQALQKELEAAKARLTEQETELAATRYEATEEFQNTIGKPLKQLEAALQSVATDFEIDPVELSEAANLKGKARGQKLAELALEMSDYDRTKFYSTVDKYTELKAQAAISSTEAKARYDALMQNRRQSDELKAAEAASKIAEHRPKVWEKLSAQAEFLKDAAPEVATKVADARKFAENADFTQQPIEAQVEIMQRAAVWPVALAQIQRLTQEKAMLETRLGELRGATPRAGGDPSKKPAPSDDGSSNETFEERFNKALAAGELH